MKCLRTPDECFENLPGWDYSPRYTEIPDGEGGAIRIHHVDEGKHDAEIMLCMHGQPTWSYLYRHMIPELTARGLRVIAPDLVGYGRSDKPSRREDYSYQRQVDWMTAWLHQNDFRDITLVGQDWGGLIGLRLVAENPDRFSRVVVANTDLPIPEASMSDERIAWVRNFRDTEPTPTLPEVMQAITKANPKLAEASFAYWQKWCWETEDLPVGALIAGMVHGRALSPEETAAYDAPFPDPSFKMGCRAMPTHVPTLRGDPSIPALEAAWRVLETWEKPFLCAFSDNDPVTRGCERHFIKRVPAARKRSHPKIQGGGHFLQEGRGPELAKIVANFIAEG
ncbi:MAG: haloalkane dehalogenase [Deltaproteobacteria bacterium]|jgi:haloalkane dehalogenase|nr:haloalkane dehalogenase [Deltaproteobacteria bacterium]MBW2498266.1 haloalkane dehalogenase [Deltaproteobacteria bacterium]